MWNLTNRRHNEEKGWTTAPRTQARGSGRDAHLANGGNAWVWHRVQTSNCAGREGLGNPPSLLCSHWAGKAEPERAELLM